MTAPSPAPEPTADVNVDVDVIVIGAGLSGVDVAGRLTQRCPGLSVLVLEARDAIGGTWDLFRYPGIRSDSELYTYGYPFWPWTRPEAFASGRQMRDYIQAAASAYGIDRLIRLGHRVVAAGWSSDYASWTVEARVAQTGESARTARYRCSFLYLCTGYYSYAAGYQPAFEGLEEYRGRFVHPQAWPADLDCAGRDVVVIGSGATAVTLAPALAAAGARVRLVQRSPGYVTALPSTDRMADGLRRWLPVRIAHRLLRLRGVAIGQLFYLFCRIRPAQAAALLRGRVASRLGWQTVREHFTPAYRPWDQRICVAPDGDLFTAIADGSVEMVTDRIERFLPTGIRLVSGREITADVVVSATGLVLEAAGGIALTVDGRPIRSGELTTYRGIMFDGVPNLAYPLGYAQASWTLRVDLAARWVCRLLRRLQRDDLASATPRMRSPQPRRPWFELNSGYLRRSAELIPRQGTRAPWRVRSNYFTESLDFALTPLGWQLELTPRRPGQRRLGAAQPDPSGNWSDTANFVDRNRSW